MSKKIKKSKKPHKKSSKQPKKKTMRDWLKQFGCKDNRTKLIEEVQKSPMKTSEKLEVMRTIKRESKDSPKIKDKLKQPIHAYNKVVNTTKEAKAKKLAVYREKWGCTTIKSALENKKAERMTKNYKEIDVPPGYTDVHYETTVRFKANIENNSKSNYFSLGLTREEHHKIKKATPKQALNVLQNLFSQKIVSHIDKYKELNNFLGEIQIAEIDGWWGGLYDED